MPIPVSAIVASRLVSVYIMGLMYSAVVIIPAWIVYMVTAGVNIKNLFGGMILTLLISVFVMTLSCLLGYVVAKVSLATVYKGNIIKNLIMDCQSYTKYRPNETTGGIFVSWRRKEELPTGA